MRRLYNPDDIAPDMSEAELVDADVSTRPCVWCGYAIIGEPSNLYYCSRVCVESARAAAGLAPDSEQIKQERDEFWRAYDAAAANLATRRTA